MRGFRFRLSLIIAARVFGLRPKTNRPTADEAPRPSREKISGTQGSRLPASPVFTLHVELA